MQFTIREVIMIGGVCVSIGGIFTWTLINTQNITALWKQKQDTNVCFTAHGHIESDIQEIKADVKMVLKETRAANGRKK